MFSVPKFIYKKAKPLKSHEGTFKTKGPQGKQIIMYVVEIYEIMGTMAKFIFLYCVVNHGLSDCAPLSDHEKAPSVLNASLHLAAPLTHVTLPTKLPRDSDFGSLRLNASMVFQFLLLLHGAFLTTQFSLQQDDTTQWKEL